MAEQGLQAQGIPVPQPPPAQTQSGQQVLP